MEFRLLPRDLEILDLNYKWTVEPGDFTVMVGASSEDMRLKRDFTVVEAGRLLEMRASERKGSLAAKVSASIADDKAANTVDGNLNTVWEGTKNQYITYELRSGAKPTSIGIAWDEGAPVEFEIQLSSGGGLFIPVWKGKSRLNNGSMETYSFDGATSSDLRIVILSDKGRIKEVKLDEL